MGNYLDVIIAVLAFWTLGFLRAPLIAWTVAAAVALVWFVEFFTLGGFLCWAAFAAIAVVFNMESIRQNLVTQPILEAFRKVLPPMSETEREALEAGDVWWEGEMFAGSPDWNKLLKMPAAKLNEEEQAFVDNQVATVCEMIDDWTTVHEDADLSPEVWDYLKKERFFGMVISKKYGGLGFSAIAHSEVVMRIATRSLSAAVNTMVPNSLGPGELLHHYGTDEQKQRWLPGLACGDEIPCFALTSPEAGSDAGSIPDAGVITKGQFEGKEVLGMRLNWDKHYITLAPVATVLGLAFKLYDPDGLLGDKKDLGITCALIPTNHPGIECGKRHFPLNQAFMNGTTYGKDVFIPLDWIIGGPEMAGQGWRMLVECLSIGRSISLPALATANGKLAYRTTGAYSRVRKQFGTSIGYFEGVEEQLAMIATNAYKLDACRRMTANAVDLGVRPSVPSAIAKYHMTEMGREVANAAMDVHGGKGIQLGPKNYLGRAYEGVPVSITVEGANILTRNLMIFGQGAIRCHPYVFPEMEAARETDPEKALSRFDKLLWAHVGFGANNFFRALTFGLTGGRLFIKSPVSGPMAHYYRQFTRMSSALALTADVAMGMLGGELKRKERLSARLADVLSYLYIGSTVLKYYEDNGRQKDELDTARYSLDDLLYKTQVAFDDFFDNFGNPAVSLVLKRAIFPYGRSYRPASDALAHKMVKPMLQPCALRDRISSGAHISPSETDGAGQVEIAFQKLQKAEPLEIKLRKAQKKGKVNPALSVEDQIQQAVEVEVFSQLEADILLDYEKIRREVVRVDEFDHCELARNNKNKIADNCQKKAKVKVAKAEKKSA
ncbi:acyl-CoA dehydrogenase [Pelagibaculum spongiae]|uniref:Acyl-coenzyme A dehydrogenase n=1 Tax=Pelagibaculum spongiae TaxID=2080658 RepID=A0A2V1H0G3_9GAMM|nr:acyl-CoA dehydrogenase [Pelagibaculum spongiae]PVZ68789.1 acyl-CoA dehydrogenase [Pelagibaculum spongiae]